jgi:hypothetical protein
MVKLLPYEGEHLRRRRLLSEVSGPCASLTRSTHVFSIRELSRLADKVHTITSIHLIIFTILPLQNAYVENT